MKTQTRKPIYAICECAIFIALAVVLSMFIEIPVGFLGGSIGFGMIPLFIICYRFGVKYSFLSCFAFSVLYVIIGGKTGYGLPSILLDYVLAYTAVGVAGFFAGKSKFIEISVLLGCLARFVFAFISGVTIYAISGPTELDVFNLVTFTTSNVALYSIIYNAVYLLPNTIIAIAVMSFLRIPLNTLNKKY